MKFLSHWFLAGDIIGSLQGASLSTPLKKAQVLTAKGVNANKSANTDKGADAGKSVNANGGGGTNTDGKRV